MSGTFPATPGPSSVTVRSATQSLVSVAQSGRRFVRDMGGHRWLINASYDRLSSDEGRIIKAFAVAQNGVFESFQFVAPHLAPRGVATGVPLVNGASQSGRSVATDGWTPNITGIMLAGDFIKFGHSKVYVVTANANSNSLGQAVLSIEPPLMISPPDNDPLTVTNVPFTVSFAKEVQEFPVQSPIFYRYEADMAEVY